METSVLTKENIKFGTVGTAGGGGESGESGESRESRESRFVSFLCSCLTALISILIVLLFIYTLNKMLQQRSKSCTTVEKTEDQIPSAAKKLKQYKF
jgi:hypothetical protein